MTQASDSVGSYNAGGSSSQDQDVFAYGVDAYAQHWLDEKADDIEAVKFSTTEFGPSAFAPEIGENERSSTPTLNIESDNGLPGDHSQWSQIQTPLQNSISHGSDARSCFGSDCNFALQELVKNPNQAFETELTRDWQFSDFEDDPTVEGASRLNDAMATSCGYQPMDPGSGNLPTQLLLASSLDGPNGFENRINARVRLKTDLWPSTPDVSLSLEPNPQRPTRRSNVLATRSHERPKVHLCDRCSSGFNRAGDLRRHYRVHFPERRTFHCLIEGCNRNGPRGFYRRDKFRDHQRQAHRFDGMDGLVLLKCI